MSIPLRLCECGCGVSAYPSQLTFLKVAGHTHWVRKVCRNEYRMELDVLEDLKFVLASVRGQPCWRRWQHAGRVGEMVYELNARIHGHASALRTASRTKLMFCFPQRLGLFISRFWK